MVMQQIANLSSRLGCIGSSPILSAIKKPSFGAAFFYAESRFTENRFHKTHRTIPQERKRAAVAWASLACQRFLRRCR